ncbi:alanine racemase [Sulfoacidibacillus thermotolerans]|uniref:alanine racemase n=1 Tax=Sulfoacidibacillus thermotolerans TaxID=1765684 RepID=UPI002482E292|nr:alanine racemase [Sulfoacidibacillus thermotolerans]
MWRQTWAEINLEDLVHNVRLLKGRLLPNVLFMATVKADAYGHGASTVAQAVLQAGADRLGVATYEEGAQLRMSGIETDILVYGALFEAAAEAAVKYRLTATVGSIQDLIFLEKKAKEYKNRVTVHVKIDTGMTRLGVRTLPAALELLQRAAESPWLTLEGLFTHFASADEELLQEKSGIQPRLVENDPTRSLPFVEQQRLRFEEIASAAQQQGIHVPILHAANSAAALRDPRYQYNMVRYGIAMYGYSPIPMEDSSFRLRPVLSLRSRITRLAVIEPGEAVSYGRTYVATRREVIATVPIGYADGIPRALSNVGKVKIHGQCAPIVGRVCMDQLMINVTDLSVKVGDVVTFYGESEGCGSLAQVAAQLDTIPYELLCRVSARVPRIITYVKNLEETCH